MKIKTILLLVAVMATGLFAQTEVIPFVKKQATSFAIVTDKETYNRVKDAIIEYRNSIENDGLSAYILVGAWKNPDEIKTELVKLYNSKPALEGAVFIGNIPVPMITKAQFMTTAFKLAEDRNPVEKSSVASDRFYDDFDLKFNYIKKDSVNPLFYYYSLAPESPQKIEKDIYSARIKPSVNDESKYEIIKKYLLRVAKQKSAENVLDNAFVFTGHGYYSESLTSWGDERLTLKEQFPGLFSQGGMIRNIHYSMTQKMKDVLLGKLEQKGLDMALFHAHGNPDMQYLIEYPLGDSPQGNIESVKLYLRGKLRGAKEKNKDLEETKKSYIQSLGVPESWFDGAFVDSVIAADSILGYSLDMYSEDIDKIAPQADYVMFDECFNGSFHKENYIAGKYVFGNGNVVAAEGNTVNALQDKWPDELLGLFNYGVRVGERHRFINYLESHIIGDPTYRFKSSIKNDLNKQIVLEGKNEKLWKEYLKSEDANLRDIAVVMLYRLNGSAFEKDLFNIYKNDEASVVRLQALKCLAEIGGESFFAALKLSITDPYELIRRFTAVWMGESGREEYIPYLVKATFEDEGERVTFNTKSEVAFINPEKAIAEIEKYCSTSKYYDKYTKEILINSLKGDIKELSESSLPLIKNESAKLKDRISGLGGVKSFRNYKYQQEIPELIKIAKDNSINAQVREAIVEVLGWYALSIHKQEIIDACKELSQNSSSPANVKAEAVKTLNRMKSGFNNVVTP
jgi:hypothetical protein